jgi:hypothetical protein
MTRKEYWSQHKARIRVYLESRIGRREVVDQLMVLVRRRLNQVKGSLTDQRTAYAIAHDLARPYSIPSLETQRIIMAMEITGNAGGYHGSTPVVLAEFLEGFHRDELDNPRPYHPVIRDVDLDSVDWLEVALCVAA